MIELDRWNPSLTDLVAFTPIGSLLNIERSSSASDQDCGMAMAILSCAFQEDLPTSQSETDRDFRHDKIRMMRFELTN